MANKPNIRFKGFTDDWEQRKLGEDLESIQTGTNLLGSENNNGMPLLKMGNIQRGYFDTSKLEYLVDNKSVEPENVAYYGDFFFNTRNTMELVGKGATWTGESGKYAFNSNIARFKLKGIDTIFFNFLYNTDSMAKQVHARAMGTTSVAAIYPRSLDSIDYCLPCIDEQKRIGDYFRNLDHLITLHQRKCDETKKLKKFMLQKMFPKNGEKNPEIRFAGFTDDWEQRKFDELFTGLQNNTLSRSELNYENGTLMDVHYGDILVKFGEYIDVSKHQLPYINDATIANKYDGSFLKDGDIIIADTAEDSTVGKCTEILGANNYLLISGLHTIPCRPMIKFASKYLGYYMNSSAYRKQLIPLMQGIKVTSISKSSIYDTKLIFPKSISEQAKIGEYFSTLDRLITLHQRKCDKLKLIKKFMLQNMFPKKG